MNCTIQFSFFEQNRIKLQFQNKMGSNCIIEISKFQKKLILLCLGKEKSPKKFFIESGSIIGFDKDKFLQGFNNESLNMEKRIKKRPWHMSSLMGCMSLEASHAKHLAQVEGDPQLWIYNFDQPKMNHQKEDINTCTYKRMEDITEIYNFMSKTHVE